MRSRIFHNRSYNFHTVDFILFYTFICIQCEIAMCFCEKKTVTRTQTNQNEQINFTETIERITKKII